ncbi:hypothetical protein [Kineothrix sp. MB12-C1]|uniref:hypothetical protein n=1 Tax=Kineothrix sp. MB12-C1 TaxID=3070215 RepID=UPI0027D2900C|nr:hypothetical protein [Kineothrix sp. MB12-C1]WMC93502.1 hypothetical protein RBB56_04250 [Kineothrix sp. MB12-C1]
MEKLIEKLGLYDVWTIMFPGIVFIGGLSTLHKYIKLLPNLIENTSYFMEKIFCIFNVSIYYPQNIYEFFMILVASYLVGLILHEISSILKKVIFYSGKPTEFLLCSKGKVFNQQEIDDFIPIFTKINNHQSFSDDIDKKKQESKKIFNYINSDVQANDFGKKYVKLNVIYNTCSTLAVTMILLLAYVISYCIEFLIERDLQLIIALLSVVVVLIGLTYILVSRSKRYYIYWTRSIVYAYNNMHKQTQN